MKKITLVLVLFAASASAQTVVGIGQSGGTGGQTKSSTAAQDLLSAQARNLHNARLCLANGLARTCTQAQLNAVPNCAAGACGTIYTAGVAGVQSYALDKMFVCFFDDLKAQVNAQNVRDADAQITTNGGLIAPDAICTGVGLSNGCTKFAAACMALNSTTDCKP